jgi:hypothetical protein
MQFYKIFVVAAFISLFGSSCIRKLALKYVGVYDERVSVKKIKSNTKEIAFLEMHHLGKELFYKDAIEKLEALKKEGYYVYFEGVSIGNSSDSNEIKMSMLKMRSVTGIDFLKMKSNNGYIDSSTGMSLLPDAKLNKLIKKEGFVNQPSALKRASDTAIGKKVDATLIAMIEDYEIKYGSIELSDYDKSTPLGADYDLKKVNRIPLRNRNYLIENLRNKIIVATILTDTHPKIAMVYGKKHYAGILELLQNQDPSMVEIK